MQCKPLLDLVSRGTTVVDMYQGKPSYKERLYSHLENKETLVSEQVWDSRGGQVPSKYERG